ncbi:hypothetical protein L3X38_038718 [Prunus dulcis]|uniref:Uncharacterized protein n=1 Tax=Prunus dulcis TaxID=3755 RepID=A0AAD4V5W6_PRUDU|nr:hypothetical protein L3X38_038718 [Prunus dulcis]
MCLEKAEIFLKHGVDNNDFSNVLEVLCSVCRAKVLILSGEMTKALLREGPVSTPCGDISYLGMHIESLDNICSL